MATVFLKLGDKANSFFDPFTNLSLAVGEVKEVEKRVSNSPKVKRAIQGGHITFTTDPANGPEVKDTNPEVTGEDLLNSFKEKYASGASEKSLAAAFNLEKLKLICTALDIDPEENDTKATLVTAILDEVKEAE